MNDLQRIVVAPWSGTLPGHVDLVVWHVDESVRTDAYHIPDTEDLLMSPQASRHFARGLVDIARRIDGQGLKTEDVETCVALVRGLLDRWGEPFENDWASVAKRGEELVDWIGEEFMPQALNVSWPGDQKD